MRKREGKLVFAPTDLAGFLKSPYATWMDRLALEEPEAPAKDEADEYLEILAAKGYAHEEAVRVVCVRTVSRSRPSRTIRRRRGHARGLGARR